MERPYILGIDIGTGSTKAVAVDLSGKPFDSVQSYYPTHHSRPGFAEQNPTEIWQGFIFCLQVIIKKLGAPLAVPLSSAMHSVIAVDPEGNVLYPMITWADGRSATIAAKLRDSDKGERIYRATGTPVYAMAPLSKIIWLKENEAAIFSATYKFVSIKEFIWFQLFGTFEIDYSIASGTGLFDIVEHNWYNEALAAAGINDSHLSKPVNTTFARRQNNAGKKGLDFLQADMLFVIGGSDGCLANLGSLAIMPGVAALTIGTSGAVRVCNTSPVYNFRAMTFNYCLDETLFVSGGPINNGGVVLQWLLMKLLGKQEPSVEDYQSLFDEAQLVPAGSNGLIFLPYLSGERAPLWTTETCGVFFGITLRHDRAHFYRAVLEGICFSLRHVLESVERNAALVSSIKVSGGFVKSAMWTTMLADITGKRISIGSTEDASALGAAYIAMRSLSMINDYKELKPATEQFIEPDSATFAKYEKNYLIFKSLYPALKDAMHQLHQL